MSVTLPNFGTGNKDKEKSVLYPVLDDIKDFILHGFMRP